MTDVRVCHKDGCCVSYLQKTPVICGNFQDVVLFKCKDQENQ